MPRYSNGERYSGEWQYGQRHGRGTYTYADGGSYSGDWERDKIQGEGTAKYSDNNVYSGSWTNGKIHGRGRLETAKFSYEGEWRDGKKCDAGQGRKRVIRLYFNLRVSRPNVQENPSTVRDLEER